MTVRSLRVINTASFRRVPGRLLEPELRTPQEMAVLCFLIEREEGHYLIDAGIRTGVVEGLLQRLGRLDVPPGWGLEARLQQLGLVPADIRGVLATHLDLDHVGGFPLVSHATLHVHQAHWAEIQRPRMRDRLVGRYSKHEIAALQQVSPFDCDHHHELGGVHFHSHDLFGDGSVRALELAGHTTGHCGYLVALEAGPVLLCGDAAYTAGHLKDAPFGLFPRTIAINLPAAEGSVARLRAVATAAPDLPILPSHAPWLAGLGDEAPPTWAELRGG